MTIEHIEQSIQKALRGESNLTEEELSIRGFSTPTMRHLWNNLCNTGSQLTYLEAGLYCGATFCSSFNENTVSIGIEDFSQDFSVSTVKEELASNCIRFALRSKEHHVIPEDCFAMDKGKLPDNIDIFFYDGNHSEEYQAKALPHFFDKMADRFIFIVDDFNWPEVFNGTSKGLNQLADKIIVERVWALRGYNLQDDPAWHNGLCIYLIKKK